MFTTQELTQIRTTERPESARAGMIFRRTYCRPTNEEGTTFETRADVVARVQGHQRWLWERTQGAALSAQQVLELDTLGRLLQERAGSLSGRTMWLGGTDVAKRRELSQFNCAGLRVSTVHDFVDFFWLLLNGVGPGAKPQPGTLSGFADAIPQITVVPSSITVDEYTSGRVRGREGNVETLTDGVWTIAIGDSAEAWAKAVGKILANKRRATHLVLDFSQIRPAGIRLKGYGWIGAGYTKLAEALQQVAGIMNRRAGQILRFSDIHDIANILGTVLSTRRSAEIVMCDYGAANWREFASFKKGMWESGRGWREMSNNSLVFWETPLRSALVEVFDLMLAAGGSEPGLTNGAETLRRAPWFAVYNPCAEIPLPDKGFCNLVTTNVAAFSNLNDMLRAVYLFARANYRQTCVDLRDGILQDAWHQNNDHLRLCGVSLTGQQMRPDLSEHDYKMLRNAAVAGAYSMAAELGTPLPKNVTTGKPEGTQAKCLDVTEGAHKPLAKYIFNNVGFGAHDPLVPLLRAANYRVAPHPVNKGDWLITLPAQAEGVEFDTVLIDGQPTEVDLTPALVQLDHYRKIQRYYCEQNQSITVSYSPDEVPGIIDWLLKNWDDYCGVSFLLRADPTKTAADLGYKYLPQQPVTAAVFHAYTAGLLPVDLTSDNSDVMLDTGAECAGGACPVR